MIVTYVTTASVLAWVAVTFVGLDLAVCSAETGLAGTGVTALAGVGAGSVIPAGLVIGAEIQVLVAEQATPSLLASALPGLAAGAV